MAMSGEIRRTGRPLRRMARLLLGRNELRRLSDRIEGAILVALPVAFLTAAVVAAFLSGHIYQSQRAAGGLRPTIAVLSKPDPVVVNASEPTAYLRARATWRMPDGSERSGMLTSWTAPAIYGARTGSVVPVWLDQSGNPQSLPAGQDDIILNTLTVVTVILAVAAVLLLYCYRLCRLALDRHRLARWELAWAATGPRWTSRQ
jgi:hypothetical protein